MSLADFWSEGGSGEYLPVGEHSVHVASVKFITYNSGNRGIEYTVTDAHRRKATVSFVLVEKALWKLATFVAALGVTKDQARAFDPERIEHHQRMIGRGCMIEIEKGEKYLDVTRWWKFEDVQTTPAPSTPVVDTTPADDYGDVPF